MKHQKKGSSRTLHFPSPSSVRLSLRNEDVLGERNGKETEIRVNSRTSWIYLPLYEYM